MISTPISFNENHRLQTLRDYDILETETESSFDDLTELAAQICETPMAVICFVDKDRQWFKSSIGLPVKETPREVSICTHAILQDELYVVPDTSKDIKFANNPFVLGAPYFRSYAGIPLKVSNGQNIGTLCVIDSKVRTFSQDQAQALIKLGHQVVAQVELRKFKKDNIGFSKFKNDILKERERLQGEFDQFAKLISRDLDSLDLALKNILNWFDDERENMKDGEADKYVVWIARRIEGIISMIQTMQKYCHSGQLNQHIEALDYSELVYTEWERLAPSQNAQLKLLGNIPAVHGETVALDKATQFVLRFCLRYSDKVNPQVDITARNLGTKGYEFSFKCNGPKVNTNDKHSLFDKAQMLDRKKKNSGACTDLIIAKIIVESVGGSIGFSTNENCEIRFIWPWEIAPIVEV